MSSSSANARSLARSALKIGGGIGFAAAFAIAFESGALFVALFSSVGTAAIMAGLGWSAWEHTPAPGTLTLKTLDPESLPPEVRAKLDETRPA